jgi:hypothetical protein
MKFILTHSQELTVATRVEGVDVAVPKRVWRLIKFELVEGKLVL